MEAFITGSRAYGKPKPASDVDLVVRMSLETLEKLAALCENQSAGGKIVFGDLNIIPCLDDIEFAVWKMGTEQMKTEVRNGQPKFSREDAIEVMNKIRKRVGIEDRCESGEGPPPKPHKKKKHTDK